MDLSKIDSPGVYVSEVNALPDRVIPVETDLAAFVGYTPQASHEGKSYHLKPTKVTSMAEFLKIFGFPAKASAAEPPSQYTPSYHLQKVESAPANGSSHKINEDLYTLEPDPNTIYYLYNSLQLFFLNGGSKAYIVSVGSYGSPSGTPISPGSQIVNPHVKLADLEQGMKALQKHPEVSLYVFPEATLLNRSENSSLMKQLLLQCGSMKTAMAIFDVKGAREPDPIMWQEDITAFRESTGNNSLMYGAAYYPYLKTSLTPIGQVSYKNLNGGKPETLRNILNPASKPNPAAAQLLQDIIDGNKNTPSQNNATLMNVSPAYKKLMGLLLEKINTLPPSGAMAGLYALADNNQGVWKAPANMSVVGASDLTIQIDNDQQAGLNVDAASGKSINAIRTFAGQGVLVWGARTLDGNSQDWRYINVRRTVTMIEQSIQTSLRAFAFEANDQDTWVAVKSSISSFLSGIWKEGGLAGANPSDAFQVSCGLGKTMTPQDILDGYLRVSVKVALSHPAEFILLNISQKMANA